MYTDRGDVKAIVHSQRRSEGHCTLTEEMWRPFYTHRGYVKAIVH